MELRKTEKQRQYKTPLFKLFLLKKELVQRRANGKKRRARRVAPRTRVPVLSTIAQVLELANHQAMSVKDIHAACELMADTDFSYRLVKSSLSASCRGYGAKFTRVGWGKYRLRVS